FGTLWTKSNDSAPKLNIQITVELGLRYGAVLLCPASRYLDAVWLFPRRSVLPCMLAASRVWVRRSAAANSTCWLGCAPHPGNFATRSIVLACTGRRFTHRLNCNVRARTRCEPVRYCTCGRTCCYAW